MRALLPVAMVLSAAAGAVEFEALFDGETLEGWTAQDMSYWSVEDGAITAQSTPENPCEMNQFLVWQGGDVADFELQLKFRLANNQGNSGIQFRSEIAANGHGTGPQADILPSGAWLGAFCSEYTGRKTLVAANGHKTIVEEDGTYNTTRIGDDVSLNEPGEWNDYHIAANGNRMVFRVNGEVSAEVIDNQAEYFRPSGILALQLRSGPPMKVQFKDIRLKNEFTSIFDGETLDGWLAPDMSYWSVEDGAITGVATPEHPAETQQFLVWQGGEVADFALKLKFRIENNDGNSGIQFRSESLGDGDAKGPQADICGGGKWLGAFCSERTGRPTLLAENGHKTIVQEDGTYNTTRIGDNVSLRAPGKWNDYYILAKGNHIVLRINGAVSAEVIDNQAEYFRPSGILALQLRSQRIQKVQFKDIWVRRLASP